MKHQDMCVAHLQATVDALVSDGADQASLITALVEVTIQTAYEERRLAAFHLETAVALLSNALEQARLGEDLYEVRKRVADKRLQRGKKRKK